MVDRGIGPEAHVRAATAQTHPFSRDTTSELDLQFVPEAYTGLGRRITDARRNRLRLLRILSPAFRDLDKLLLTRQHLKLPGAPGLRPMFCVCLVRLLRWPDVGLAGKLAFGFELAGELDPSTVRLPIARKNPGAGAPPSDSLTRLGASAADFAKELEADKT